MMRSVTPVETTLLRADQLAQMRAHLQHELDRHPTWPDLWNAAGLFEALTGNREKARNAFIVALGRNANYTTARWNLCWIDLLLASSGENLEGPETGAIDVKGGIQPIGLLPVVRNLVQGIGPDRAWSPKDPALLFSALTLAARSDNEQYHRLLAALREREPGFDELLRVGKLADDGGPIRASLAWLGTPDHLNPGYGELLERFARLETMALRDEEALRLLALAALYVGNRAFFLVEKTEILSRRGDSESSLALLREAVASNPTWHRAHLALGYELSLRGLSTEALEHMGTAVRLQPGYADIQYQFSLLLHACGRNAEAIESLKTALVMNPQFHAARVALANLLFELKRASESLAYFEKALEVGFGTPALQGRFGYALHAAGFSARAEEIFLGAVSDHPDRPDLLCLYGRFLAETERRPEARRLWSKALASDPTPEVRREIEDYLARSPA